MTARVFTDDQGRELAAKYAAGATIRALMRETGEGEKAVRNALVRAGASMRGVGPVAGPSKKKTPRTMRGAGHWNWRGGRLKDDKGYWRVRLRPDDPYYAVANRSGYALEHRYVMSQQLGRCIAPTESVHHINGQRDDNTPSNLQIRQGKHGHGIVLVCHACGSQDIGTTEIGDAHG